MLTDECSDHLMCAVFFSLVRVGGMGSVRGQMLACPRCLDIETGGQGF